MNFIVIATLLDFEDICGYREDLFSGDSGGVQAPRSASPKMFGSFLLSLSSGSVSWKVSVNIPFICSIHGVSTCRTFGSFFEVYVG